MIIATLIIDVEYQHQVTLLDKSEIRLFDFLDDAIKFLLIGGFEFIGFQFENKSYWRSRNA